MDILTQYLRIYYKYHTNLREPLSIFMKYTTTLTPKKL
jgi:hypothetical protein